MVVSRAVGGAPPGTELLPIFQLLLELRDTLFFLSGRREGGVYEAMGQDLPPSILVEGMDVGAGFITCHQVGIDAKWFSPGSVPSLFL